MAISDLDVKELFTCDGIAVDFTIPFQFTDSSQIVVYTVDITDPENPVETLMVLGISEDYTLTGATPPSSPLPTTVTFNTAPAATLKVLVKRVLPINQQIEYDNTVNFYPETQETANDKLTMLVQQMQEQLDRCLKFFPGSLLTGINSVDPTANCFLQWSNDASRIVNGPTEAELEALVQTATDMAHNASDSADAAAASAIAAAASAVDSSGFADEAQTSKTQAHAEKLAAEAAAAAAAQSALDAAAVVVDIAADVAAAQAAAANALISENNASQSAIDSAASALAASGSASSAAQSVIDAAASALAASNSASDSAGSALAASGSASAASGSAGAAAQSAIDAAGSASAADGSAQAAAQSAIDAQAYSIKRYANLAAFPSAVTEGDGVYATALDTDKLYRSDGATWKEAGGGITGYANLAAFPAASSVDNGTLGLALDTWTIYESNGTSWLFLVGPGQIRTIDKATGDTDPISIITGSSTDAGSGQVNVESGPTEGASGGVVVRSGSSTSSDSGAFELGSGQADAGYSGAVMMTTGPGVGSGSISVETGIASGDASGGIGLTTGNVAAPDTHRSGNISLVTGTTLGTRGRIFFRDGTHGTAGYIWISQDTNGKGGWTQKLPVANGGTGETTASGALTALGGERAPNGLVNPGYFALSYNSAQRKLTVTITSGAEVWVGGTKFTPITETTVAHDDTSGLWFFYYNSIGVLSISSINVAWDIMTTAPLAAVCYQSTGPKYIIIDERHPGGPGILSSPGFDDAVHKYHHLTRGTILVSGGVPSGYTLNADGTGNVRYAVSSGTAHDEDLIITINGLLSADNKRVVYRTGSNASNQWTWDDTTPNGFLDNGTNIYYNQLTGGNWVLTPITAVNTWVNYYILVTTSLATPQIVIIMGQATHASLAAAQAEDPSTAIAGISYFTTEGVYAYRMTYRRGSFGAPGNAHLASVAAVVRSIIAIGTGSLSASSIATDTTNFDSNLSTADTDVQKALDTLDAMSSGGGGIQINWIQLGGNSAIENTYSYARVFEFGAGLAQDLYTSFKVPNGYKGSKQISLKIVYSSPDATGTVLFTGIAILIKKDTTAFDSTTNQHTSTNTAAALSATVNRVNEAILDLTSSTGTINSVAVAAGDIIKVKISRGTDTATSDVRLHSNLYEVTLA